MQLPRTYTANEIKEFVDVLRIGIDVSQEQIVGMDMLVKILADFGNMTDAEIAYQVRSLYRTLK